MCQLYIALRRNAERTKLNWEAKHWIVPTAASNHYRKKFSKTKVIFPGEQGAGFILHHGVKLRIETIHIHPETSLNFWWLAPRSIGPLSKESFLPSFIRNFFTTVVRL